MDKKSIIGLVLIFLVIIGFSYLTRPSQEEIERVQRQRDSIARVQQEQQAQEEMAKAAALAADSLANIESQQTDTLFATGSSPETLWLSNDRLRIAVTTLGGRISEATLLEYKTYHGDSLRIFHGAGNRFGFRFWAGNSMVHTMQQYFQPQLQEARLTAQKAGDTAVLALRLQAPGGAYIEYRYTLPYGEYMVGLAVSMRGMDQLFSSNQQYVDLEWHMRSPQQERGAKKELEYTTLCYRTPNGDYEEFSARKDAQEEKVTTSVEWVDFKEQFFSAILISHDGFAQGDFSMQAAQTAGDLRDFKALLMLPISGGRDEVHHLQFYLGPNLYKTLASYDRGFEKVVPLGGWLVRWVNKYVVINVFDWLNAHIASYGIIILILTILIKIVVFPLTYRSYKSQAKMRVLKPMVDEINERYPRKEDAMKKQQATMALYKSAGVNPMGGCLPMLIQFPILVAMFRFFPASFELRQKGFLWADDLSSYDSVLDLPFNIPFYGDHVSLFTLLMAVSLFLTSLLNFKNAGNTNNQMPGMKFMMLYMMPIMMLFWFNDYSAGLSYYYLLANVITILQTIIIRKTIDEKALFERLKRNTQRKPKKSRFMERLEKLQREQERQQAAKKRR